LISVEQLNDIIRQGEQLDVASELDQRKMAIYGQSTKGIAVVEGPR
jgi:hypothetical protein